MICKKCSKTTIRQDIYLQNVFVTALLVSRLIMKIQVFDNTMWVCVHALECFSSSFFLCNLRRKHPHSYWKVFDQYFRPNDDCILRKTVAIWRKTLLSHCGPVNTSLHEALLKISSKLRKIGNTVKWRILSATEFSCLLDEKTKTTPNRRVPIQLYLSIYEKKWACAYIEYFVLMVNNCMIEVAASSFKCRLSKIYFECSTYRILSGSSIPF